MTTNLRVAELDFDQIKSNLKAFLRNKQEFTDYDFEGSGLSVIIDLLAYNTHYNAVMGNMLVQEMFLDTAVKRQSLGLISKRLGYTPYSKVSPRAKVNMEVFPVGSPATLTIGKGAKFTTKLSFNTVANFITLNSYTVNRNDNGRYIFQNIDLYEGSNDIFRFVVNGQINQQFEIPTKNVDISTLRVYIQTSISNTEMIEWTRFDNIVDVNSGTNSYFVKYNENGNYEVYFGDGILGKALQTGNVVRLDYIATNGPIANGASKFAFSDTVEGNTNVVVETVMNAFGGADEEPIESIRVNAQNSVLSQNRAVTASDYISEINKFFPNDSIAVYGGETLTHPIYGKVFISIKQSGTTVPLTLEQKKNLLSILTKKTVLSITHEFIDPDYIYIDVFSNINYNANLTQNTSETIKTNVASALLSYANTNFNKFDSSFEYSRFITQIDNSDNSIINNETTVYLKKRKNITLGISSDYQYDFYTQVEESNSKVDMITSNVFKVSTLPTVDCRLTDADGIMQIYYVVNGIRVILDDNVGTVDYTTGSVNVNLDIIECQDGYLEVTVNPSNRIITPGRNNILVLAENNINIHMVAN